MNRTIRKVTHPKAIAILTLIADHDADGVMEDCYFGSDPEEPLAVAVRAWRKAGRPMTTRPGKRGGGK